MLYEVADESFTFTDPAQLVAAGFRGFIGYISNDPAKNITRARIDELHAAGLMVGVVVEGTGKELLIPGAGRAFAQSMLPKLAALGPPSGFLAYWAIDVDVASSQWATALANLQAVNDVSPYRTGGYNGAPLLSWLHDQGAIEKRWVAGAYSWSGTWWPGHGTFPQLNGAELLQIPGVVLGGAADANYVMQPDWAQWNPDGTVGVAPAPDPPDPLGDLTMLCLVMPKGGGPIYLAGNNTINAISGGSGPNGGYLANRVNFEKGLNNYVSADTIGGATGAVVYANATGALGSGSGYIYAVWQIDPDTITSLLKGD